MTGSGRAGVLTAMTRPRTGLVPSTVTITHLAFEWECRAYHRWRPVDDGLGQDCVARLADLAESSTPSRVISVSARQLPHRRVKRGSS